MAGSLGQLPEMRRLRLPAIAPTVGMTTTENPSGVGRFEVVIPSDTGKKGSSSQFIVHIFSMIEDRFSGRVSKKNLLDDDKSS